MNNTVTKGSFFKQRLHVVLALLVIVVLLPVNTAWAKEKKQYANWQELAVDMHECFQRAIEDVDKGDYEAAYKEMNNAYFGHYEVQGFEATVMSYISAKRVNQIESQFRDIKHGLAGNREHDNETLKRKIILLDGRVYRDALVLDGIVAKDSSDEEGKIVLSEADAAIFLEELGVDVPTDDAVVSDDTQTGDQTDQGSEKDKTIIQEVDPSKKHHRSFWTSFTLMLREGMEAILVCVAIITYLVKTGNKHLRKGVYLGMLAGLVGSAILAVLINLFLGGEGQEMIEGWTMFLAVIVLFWVSNWMLSRSEEAAWEEYIQGQVQKSINRRSMIGLVGAAFLAVIREGAELILFYRASFAGGMTDTKYAVYGLLAATAVLIVVFVVMRFTTVKLPLKPFFLFTSILLYLMCISFMGKGVKELAEAGVISGVTTIPAMKGFELDILGIYDRAETLIPQIMLLITSLWILLSHFLKNRARKKKLNKTTVDVAEPATSEVRDVNG